ncbi:MAG: glycosyltransferase family 39 protein [Actinobacteria bacterium]|nr:glycosyltransferase family 39 protein [Actinomycetota bacterium]
MLKSNIFFSKNEIKNYFKDKTNIAIFVILLLVSIYAMIVRFKNIGVLSYWGDDGQTFLGTFGVLNYGFPKLPSGNIFYHTFFHFYLRVIPSLIFGINEVSLRFPSAFFGTLTIPLIFIFIKDLLNNKYIALLASIIVAFNAWQIEFSREVRQYSEFQFFYLLSVYLFYRGFFKEEKKFKIAALVFIFLTTIIHELGFTLIFLFIALLIYKRFKGFFKKDIIISFFVVAAMIVGQMIHRELFWKAGLVFYQSNVSGSIANPILRLLAKFFAPYIPYYHRIFDVMFPDMYKIVFYGSVLIILYLFIPWIRNKDEDFINIYSSSSGKYSIRFPFNLFFLYFLFFSNTIFNGFGFMTTQQRYIYQVHPFFIAIYCYVIFDIGRLLVLGVSSLLKNLKNKSIKNHNIKSQEYSNYIYIIIAVLILIFTVNWANPIYNFKKIVFRNNGDAVISQFAPSNTFTFHHDAKTPGQYIFDHKKEGDLVIATDLLNPYGYTRQIDYWLWTGGFSQWQPYVYKDGKMYEEFFGVLLIRDLYQLYAVLNNNADRNIWLITSNSMRVESHISPDVAEFIYSQKQNLKVTGKDGVCQAYLFEKTDKPARGYFFVPENKNIIELQPVDFPSIIGFGNKDNKDFFKYGWSQIESSGTWADKLYSVLFLKFKERLDYKITLNVLSLYDPKQPQEMEVIFNDKVIGKIQFKDSKPVEAILDIPAEIVNTEAGSYNILKFNYRYLLSPLSLGVSSDTRTLAVFFQKIVIEKTDL